MKESGQNATENKMKRKKKKEKETKTDRLFKMDWLDS